MKAFKFYVGLIALLIAIGSCSSDDEVSTDPVVIGDLAISTGISNENYKEVTVTASAGNATSYSFDFGDETDKKEATGGQVTHEYAEDGSYVITVTAMADGAENKVATESVNIMEDNPFDEIELTVTPDASVDMKVSITVTSEAGVQSYTVDFGDGSTEVTNTDGIFEYTYGMAGTYSVTAKATKGTDEISTTKSVEIEEPLEEGLIAVDVDFEDENYFFIDEGWVAKGDASLDWLSVVDDPTGDDNKVMKFKHDIEFQGVDLVFNPIPENVDKIVIEWRSYHVDGQGWDEFVRFGDFPNRLLWQIPNVGSAADAGVFWARAESSKQDATRRQEFSFMPNDWIDVKIEICEGTNKATYSLNEVSKELDFNFENTKITDSTVVGQTFVGASSITFGGGDNNGEITDPSMFHEFYIDDIKISYTLKEE